jgi:sulfur relay (sulfurtransferase) DsrC/TusE family protein
VIFKAAPPIYIIVKEKRKKNGKKKGSKMRAG